MFIVLLWYAYITYNWMNVFSMYTCLIHDKNIIHQIINKYNVY